MSDQYGPNGPGQYGGPNGPQEPPNGPPGFGSQPPSGPGFGGDSRRKSSDRANDATGFFGALFDFSFNHFVTPMIIKVVYVLATVGIGLTWLFIVIAAFTRNAGAGLVVLILGAIGALLYLALVRMTLEFYLAVVRMSEDIHKRLPPR